MSKFVICCLGNPGARYDGTRHNIGFAVADSLVSRAGARWAYPDATFAWCHAGVSGHDVIVVKPQTYMNLSGEALEELAEREPVRARDTLVVCDDIALPLGMIRLRKKGSDGGHNGLRSLIETLGTVRFPRLRLGVGPVPEAQDAADFVLEPMDDASRSEADRMIREAVKCVETVLSDGLDVAMNRFNRRVDAAEGGEE